MNFPKFQDLVEKRYGFQTMENPTATGEYFSDSCGDLYTFYLKVTQDQVIEECTYFTTGCGFGTATSSILVDLVKGKTLDEAMNISEADIEAVLDGYPEKKKDYPQRSLEALHAAIADYRKNPAPKHSDGATLTAANSSGNGSSEKHEIKVGPRIVEGAQKLTISLH